MYVIGIDIGTSGTKTVLFDELGNTVASKMVEYPLYQPHNGWAEQDPEDWWEAVKTCLKEVSGKVLRRSIIWCDQRTGEECEEIESLVGKKRVKYSGAD